MVFEQTFNYAPRSSDVNLSAGIRALGRSKLRHAVRMDLTGVGTVI